MRSPPARFHDVTLPLRGGGVTYPGDPAIRIGVHSAIARGDPANVSTLALGSHSGTHVDAPSHFLSGDDTVDQLPLERLVGPAADRLLLGEGVVIVEGLDLSAVPAGRYELICLPLRLAGLDGAGAGGARGGRGKA